MTSAVPLPPLRLLSLLLTGLCLFNAALLYRHQVAADYWLPRTEEGAWRSSPPPTVVHRAMARQYLAAQGIASFEAASPAASAAAEGALRAYVASFGRWQWPLALLAVVVNTAVLLWRWRGCRPAVRVVGISLVVLSLLCVVDAAYRRYDAALGW